MATIDDVEAALVAAIASVFYPTGTPPSVVGYPVKIYAGWPLPADLDKDMVEVSGHPTAAHISVYPLKSERNVTRFSATYTDDPLPAATYTATVAGQVVTVAGAAPATFFTQNVALIINGAAYAYGPSAGQTPAQIAQALQSLIVVDLPGTTVSGAAITLPPSARITAARVGVSGTARKPVRTVEKQVQINIWTSSPSSRKDLGALVEPVLSDTSWITLADGSRSKLTYHSQQDDDFTQKQRIYRRQLTFMVEFTTYVVQDAVQIVVQTDNLRDATGALIKSVNA